MYTKQVYSNVLKGGVTVGAVADSFNGAGRAWVTAYGGVMPSIINLSNVLNKLEERSTMNTNQRNDILGNGFLNPDDIAVKTAKTSYNNAVIWLWGSLDDGGVCVRHFETNKWVVDGCSGLYLNPANQKYFYRFYTAYVYNFTPNNFYDLCFAYWYDKNDTDSNRVLQNVDGQGWFGTLDRESSNHDHYNALWVGTTPTYVDVGTADSLKYIDADGYRSPVGSARVYANNYMTADTSRHQMWQDDAINENTSSTHLKGTLFGEKKDDNPDDNDGYNDDAGGGEGDFDNSQDPVNPVNGNQAGAAGTGIFTMYVPDVTAMQSFANFLYSSLTDGDATALKKLFSNPMDYIIGFNMTRVNLNALATQSKSVHLGGIDTSISMPYLTDQILSFDGGSLTIPQNDTFKDYSPFTKASLYVPYCQECELPIDLIIGGTLYLTYNIDVLSGALTAQLSIKRDRSGHGMLNIEDPVGTPNDKGALLYVFTGNIYTSIPLGSVDNRQLVNALISTAAATATSIASGNPIPAIASAVNTATTSKQTISRSGAVSSNFGFMSPQNAELKISRPVQSLPHNRKLFEGIPSNKYSNIAAYENATTDPFFLKTNTDTLWTDNFTKPITDAETKEIKELLNNGIYV